MSLFLPAWSMDSTHHCQVKQPLMLGLTQYPSWLGGWCLLEVFDTVMTSGIWLKIEVRWPGFDRRGSVLPIIFSRWIHSACGHWSRDCAYCFLAVFDSRGHRCRYKWCYSYSEFLRRHVLGDFIDVTKGPTSICSTCVTDSFLCRSSFTLSHDSGAWWEMTVVLWGHFFLNFRYVWLSKRSWSGRWVIVHIPRLLRTSIRWEDSAADLWVLVRGWTVDFCSILTIFPIAGTFVVVTGNSVIKGTIGEVLSGSHL